MELRGLYARPGNLGCISSLLVALKRMVSVAGQHQRSHSLRRTGSVSCMPWSQLAIRGLYRDDMGALLKC